MLPLRSPLPSLCESLIESRTIPQILDPSIPSYEHHVANTGYRINTSRGRGARSSVLHGCLTGEVDTCPRRSLELVDSQVIPYEGNNVMASDRVDCARGARPWLSQGNTDDGSEFITTPGIVVIIRDQVDLEQA